LNHFVNGLLNTLDFISRWDSKDQAMTVIESGMNSYALPATDQPTVLIFEFFHSKNKRRREPLTLPERGDLNSNLRIASVRPLALLVFLCFLGHQITADTLAL
jgi:hypothetical protein